MSKSWTIGSKPDCDLVVNHPRVSGRHCRLTQDEDGYFLEDLGSTNGTYLNGVRITGRVRVARSDSITSGLTTALPWPSEAAGLGNHDAPEERPLPRIDSSSTPTLDFQGTELVIGRVPGCDLVLDFPMVSSRHARLSRSQGRISIEDLASSNGTFVNGQRISEPTLVKAGDVISLGTYSLVLSLSSPDEVVGKNAAINPASPTPSGPEGKSAPAWTGLRQELVRALNPPWRLVALLVQAPLAAILIVTVLRTYTSSPTTSEGWAVASRAIAAVLFWLGFAAIWFGLSNAVLGNLIDAARPRSGLAPGHAALLCSRFIVLGVLGTCQCILAWVLVSNGTGLQPGLPMLALLILSSAVGLGWGLLIATAALRPLTAWGLLGLTVLAAGLLGRGPWPRSGMPSVVRTAANAVRTRWAFEGLLLLESDRTPSPEVRKGPDAGQVHDLAEDAFPAESERAGVRADVMALALMALGSMAVAGFIAHERGRVS